MKVLQSWLTCGLVGLACLVCSIGEFQAARFDGKWELSLYIPYVAFDTDAPIRDSMGLDDEIRNAFGRGVELGYNFTKHQAIVANTSWIDSDSEDNRGEVHFSIRTRYSTIYYRWHWTLTEHLSPFILLGVGNFYARALEENHPNYGGPVALGGLGLRFYTSKRSSLFVSVQASQVDLEPDDADNIMVAAGLTTHFGRSTPEPPEPPEGTP